MANVIAVIWDCDKTLVDGYMQDPIFEDKGIDAKSFWDQVNILPVELEKNGIRVNRDTFYLNYFIRCAHEKNGKLYGLNNSDLREYGKKQKFYPGIPEIFEETKALFKDDKAYSEYGIQVEHFIVSTGFAEVIRGSKLMPYVDGVWGCELLEESQSHPEKKPIINEILYTIDNTTKTRAIFEINKGIGKVDGIDVNTKIPSQMRRVQFENMIYIADGPSDIPAFSVVNQYGGSTFAIYPKGDAQAMRQIEKMRAAGRIHMYAEADYSKGTTAYLWITNKIREIANRIRETEQEKIRAYTAIGPHHLI